MVAQEDLRTLAVGKSSVSHKKTDIYEGPAFKIEHEYWGKWEGVNGTEDNGYVGSQLRVTNTADVPITVRVFLDLDDTGDIWDANVRSNEGMPVENKWIEIGNIQPKDTINTTFWWGVFNQAGVPYAETFEVTFKLAPQVTIDYQNFKPFKDSKSTVITVE